jgi:hypothetical protein
MGKFIITEDEKKRIKSLYEQVTPNPAAPSNQTATQPQTNQEQETVSLTPDIKFTINNKLGFTSGSKVGNFTSELGGGNNIVFNAVSTNKSPKTLMFLNSSSPDSFSVTLRDNLVGYMKNATDAKLDTQGVIDMLSLICRGFYGSVKDKNVINVLNALRKLQQNYSTTLGEQIISSLNSVFTGVLSLATMTGPDFQSKFTTNLVASKGTAGGGEMTEIYKAAIQFFPGKIRKV